jgi:predicted nucleic acid-binding protein
MRRYFVDTNYWVARLSKNDELHSVALELSNHFTPHDRFYTSEWVLLETLNYFSSEDRILRSGAALLTDWIETDPQHRVLSIPQQLFRQSRQLYMDHADKKWSLTDCSSFLLMRDLDIIDALAYDKHFEQAGFRALMRS